MVRPFLEADLGAGITAGFTTRAGGVSDGPWSSLNLALHVGDATAHVLANRDRLAASLGAPVHFGHQVHGRDVGVIGPAELGTPALTTGLGSACDALVSSRAVAARRQSTGNPSAGAGRVVLGVLVADCVPVLLADPLAGVVAVAHAGRRGVVAGVVDAVLEAMTGEGADVGRVRAVVGPAAGGCCYEVSDEMRADVAAVVPAAWATTRWGTPSLDLPVAVEDQLRVAGVGQVDRVAVCTIEDDRFFSYRRATAGADGQPTGRFAGVVAVEAA